MSSLNKAMLIGNCGADPEVRSFSNGGRVASLSLATSETWKDKASGERKEKTEWHRVVIYNDALVGVVERYVRKGGRIYVEGQLETRKWTDQQGQERYTTEIAVRPFHGEIKMLGGDRQDAGEAPAPSAGGGVAGARKAPEMPPTSGAAGGRAPQPQQQEIMDDIPF